MCCVWETAMLRLLRNIAFLSFLIIPVSLHADDEVTKEEAVKLLFNQFASYLSPEESYIFGASCNTGSKGEFLGCCGGLPDGTYKLTSQTENLTRAISKFEKAGLVTVTPQDTKSGDVFKDLFKMAENGLSATVKVSPAGDLDKDQLSSMPVLIRSNPPKSESKACMKLGKATLKEVVNFTKIHAPGNDGIGFDAYVLQGTYTYEPSPLETKLLNNIATNRKFQAIIRRDPFTKRDAVIAGQGVDLSSQFNSTYFSSKLGHGLLH